MSEIKLLTKEEWEHWREMPNIPIDVWFSFYREKGGYVDNVDDFTNIFLTLVNNNMIVTGTDGTDKRISAGSAWNNMKPYYDHKFGIDVQTEEVSGAGSGEWDEIFKDI